ncbi:hypothetical protein [Suttonella ornithocola]|uniref:Integrating conjugative element protein, PFL_4695 family n=1 Tax=Suttonella ornithocola TaxID=279832 RepID=A0A380MYQ1_9GAMM|nr:hypothetical protein [Suttonella ornithocola]SUO96811.1 Uncharacterised protein [Suttonella ornithocola]
MKIRTVIQSAFLGAIFSSVITPVAAQTNSNVNTSKFEQMDVEQKNGYWLGRIALIDGSALSRSWLVENRYALARTYIMYLGSQSGLEELREFLKEQKIALNIGIIPEPRSHMYHLLDELGINKIPAVVEGSKAWQVNPHPTETEKDQPNDTETEANADVQKALELMQEQEANTQAK